LKQEAPVLKAKIVEIRTALRTGHRDAVGDDRCWVDDYLIWKFLPNPPLLVKPSTNEAMRRCRSFYHLRRSETKDLIPRDANLDPTLWDADLEGKCRYQLEDKFGELLEGFNTHFKTSLRRELTLDDDRQLYMALPEKIPADFRLPPEPEFLDRAKDGAGCPNFWNSHTTCGNACNLHQWGPCR
jgi:hypothetical protein